MAEITPQPDGSAQITVTQAETAGLRALAALHLPFLARAEAWLGADTVPEVAEAAGFLRSLTSSPAGGSTLTVSASQAETLRGLVNAHVPDFQGVLAVVESPAVRSMLGLAKALL